MAWNPNFTHYAQNCCCTSLPEILSPSSKNNVSIYTKRTLLEGRKKYPRIQILTPLKRDILECKISRVCEKVWHLPMGILCFEHTSPSISENSPTNCRSFVYLASKQSVYKGTSSMLRSSWQNASKVPTHWAKKRLVLICISQCKEKKAVNYFDCRWTPYVTDHG